LGGKQLPELPEVETIKRTLELKLAGRTIREVTVLFPGVIGSPSPEQFADGLRNVRVRRLGRRGKFLLVELDAGQTLVIHFRMTGRLIYHPGKAPPAEHTHVVFDLDGDSQLHFMDTRKFGRLWLLPNSALTQHSSLGKLGREPLEEGFTREFLRLELPRRRTRIKPLLLDQTFIAGLGNIYADEALHLAGLHPEKPAQDLSFAEISRLHRAIQRVLQDGIEHHGTTLRDYLDGAGTAGRHQDYLRVHRRTGLPCPVCGTRISRKKVGGRSTHYCPCCQKDSGSGE
jgi:formamidopyrimidine-DNA glycosylase